MAGDGDPMRKPPFFGEEASLEEFLDSQEERSHARMAGDMGTSFYDVIARYEVSPFLMRRILATYRRAMGSTPDYEMSHEEQDRVLNGTRVYAHAHKEGEYVIDVPFTMKNGKKNFMIITTNVGEVMKKQ